MLHDRTWVGPRIVVGVTEHPDSTQTLSWALAEAAVTGRSLVVAYSCPSESALASSRGAALTALLELAEPSLALAVVSARQRFGDERVSLAVRPDPPDELLTGLACPSDLLVVGAPRSSGWLCRPSTTDQVLRHASGPVVVVKPRPESLPHASFEGMVVVGVDGSLSSQAALAFAFAYAQESRRTVVAVNATDQHDYDVWYDDQFRETHLVPYPPSLDLLATEVESWERKYPDVRVWRAVFGGSPVEGMMRAAKRAAMLVVGDRGVNSIRRTLLGSVSEAAVDRAACPVAIVRPS